MNARDLLASDAAMPIGCGETTVVPAPEIVGFKAHNLARLAQLGLPVPPAFVLGTAWCARPEALTAAVWQRGLAALEQASGEGFGDARRPLLVSVRSGAPVSMPGMMETLLNIGLASSTLRGFLRATGNPRLVWDAYRRLIAGFGEVVLGVPAEAFEADLAAISGGRDERELDYAELRALAETHLATVQRESGRAFPQDPQVQLEAAIRAVFASWNADKARAYRRMHGLPDSLGTAVTVQRMVFGNAGGRSGAGVGFTRQPSTGEPQPWIDYLANAQGEDVVSGRRSARGHEELAATSPALWTELQQVMQRLEAGFGDMQDFEFTVESGRLWLLQTRDGKRTKQAQARIALDLLDEDLIDAAEARRRTDGLDEAALASRVITGSDGDTPLAHATPAAHGVASGELVLDEERARQRANAGTTLILVRQDAETRDVAALDLAAGLLTQRGARTSHAAVVARQMGKVCLVGCETLRIDLTQRRITLGEATLAEGELLTLDGHEGRVYRGVVQAVEQVPAGLMARLRALRAVG